jgi:hypothetical protein
MFKKLLEQLKNLFKTKAPKEILDNPIASKTVDNQSCLIRQLMISKK